MSDLVAKVEAMRQKAKAKSEENRRNMPTVASWFDEAKDIFGADQVKVGYAKENGITLGTPTTNGINLSETLVGQWNKPSSTGAKRK